MNLVDFKDFPVFQHWDFNTKEFKPRALNNLSVRFNEYLERRIKEIITEHVVFLTERHLINYLVKKIVNAAKYSLFGNASFEAEGPGSYGGGNDSIQEQFVCWVLDVPAEDYRNKKVFAYSDDLYESKVLYNWVKDSELLEYIKEKLR